MAPYSSTQNTATSGSLSYANALKLYGTRRIQFDTKCALIPNDPTYKAGTTIMLDNRSSKSRAIALDNVAYNLGAYGYKIVTLTTTYSLPHTILVDCGVGQNNDRILLQK